MQTIDEICPAYLTRRFLKRPPFFVFKIKTCFMCNPIFGSSMGVQKELGKNLFFPRNLREGIYRVNYQAQKCLDGTLSKKAKEHT